MPLICSAYVGLAESAGHLALDSAKRKGADLAAVTGDMNNSLTIARLALDDMIRLNDNHRFAPAIELVVAGLDRREVIALFAEAEQHYTGVGFRAFRVDPLTPHAVEARLLQAGVLRGVAAAAGDIDDQRDLALVVGQ